jgi:hypothetical protein
MVERLCGSWRALAVLGTLFLIATAADLAGGAPAGIAPYGVSMTTLDEVSAR